MKIVSLFDDMASGRSEAKMTIDETINRCLKVAEQNEQGLYDAIALGGQNPTQEEIANCEQCAEEHRQLAEWLRELKETKKLLKLAVKHLNCGSCIKDCRWCVDYKSCDYDNRFEWIHTGKALKLIGDDDTNG